MASPTYPKPNASVDLVVFGLQDDVLKVQVLRRRSGPEKGKWALPGGYVHVNEERSLDDVVERVVRDKVQGGIRYVEQLGTVGNAARDERGWSISVAYIAIADAIRPLDSATGWQWVSVDDLPPLAFDHAHLVAQAAARLRTKSTYSSLAAFLLPDEFTLPELIDLYEHVLGTPLEQSAFRRKIDAQNLIEPIEGKRRAAAGAGRPAQLYRLTDARLRDFGRVISGRGDAQPPAPAPRRPRSP